MTSAVCATEPSIDLVEQIGELGPPASQAGPRVMVRASKQPPRTDGVEHGRLALDGEERGNSDHWREQRRRHGRRPPGRPPDGCTHRGQPRAVDRRAGKDLRRREHVALARDASGDESGQLIGHEEDDEAERAQGKQDDPERDLADGERPDVARGNLPVEVPIAETESLQPLVVAA